jgi:hypothetical protein
VIASGDTKSIGTLKYFEKFSFISFLFSLDIVLCFYFVFDDFKYKKNISSRYNILFDSFIVAKYL